MRYVSCGNNYICRDFIVRAGKPTSITIENPGHFWVRFFDQTDEAFWVGGSIIEPLRQYCVACALVIVRHSVRHLTAGSRFTVPASSRYYCLSRR